MRRPEIDNLSDIVEVTGTGTYNQAYRYGVGIHRRTKKPYAYILGFAWSGNEASINDRIYPITPDQAARIRSYIIKLHSDNSITDNDVCGYILNVVMEESN